MGLRTVSLRLLALFATIALLLPVSAGARREESGPAGVSDASVLMTNPILQRTFGRGAMAIQEPGWLLIWGIALQSFSKLLRKRLRRSQTGFEG